MSLAAAPSTDRHLNHWCGECFRKSKYMVKENVNEIVLTRHVFLKEALQIKEWGCPTGVNFWCSLSIHKAYMIKSSNPPTVPISYKIKSRQRLSALYILKKTNNSIL